MYTYVYEHIVWCHHMCRLFYGHFAYYVYHRGQAGLAMRICGNCSSCCENKNSVLLVFLYGLKKNC